MKEQYWIHYYNSQKEGYNETDAIYKSGGNTYQNKTKDELNNIKAKLQQSKLGEKNPNATRIKCLDTLTHKEIVFDTVLDCQKYFNEPTHRFITTRITRKTKSLYNDRWAFAYMDQEYQYQPTVNKSGEKIKVHDEINNQTKLYESIRLACRELNLPRYKIAEQIKRDNSCFSIDNYIIHILD